MDKHTFWGERKENKKITRKALLVVSTEEKGRPKSLAQKV